MTIFYFTHNLRLLLMALLAEATAARSISRRAPRRTRTRSRALWGSRHSVVAHT